MNKWFLRFYMDEADPGDGSGGSAGGSADNDEGDGKSTDGDEGDDKSSDKGSSGPTDEEAKLLQENMKKKEQISNLKKDLQKTQEALKKFDGIDLDVVTKLLKDQKDAEDKRLEEKGQWDNLKQRMADEHEKVVGEKDTKITELESSLKSAQEAINKLTVGNAFDNSNFIKEKMDLTPNKVRQLFGGHFEIDDEGNVTAYDKPAGARERTALVDASGKAIGFNEAIEKLVNQDPDKESLLKSTVVKGANSDSDPGAPSKDSGKKTSLDKIGEGLAQLGKSET